MARKAKPQPATAPETVAPAESGLRAEPAFVGPSFAATFPRDPELDVLVDAFARGDYRRVREAAPGLAERAEDPAVRRAALELRARIDPDPIGRTLIVLAAGLLLVLAYFYLAHQHGPP